MYPHRIPWIHAGAALVLVLTLAACNRSADSALTPLPSAPPPTPTALALTEPSLSPSPEPVRSNPTASSTATPSPTNPPQTATATIARAVTATATSALCGSALPSRLRVNGYAYVNPDPPLPNNLRSEAGPDNELIGEIQPGKAMKLLAGPKCMDGGLWWQVNPLGTELTGWTAEGDDQGYWLLPCASEQECGT